jgi:hypothetical protein
MRERYGQQCVSGCTILPVRLFLLLYGKHVSQMVFQNHWHCLAESKNSQQLLLRTVFHGQVEYRSSTLIAQRLKADPVLP